MKLGVLFSGGKDSTYAAYLAEKEHKLGCLITMQSVNPDSYMFHTPAIELTSLQAEAMNIPLVTGLTDGKKESELKDLKNTIKRAVVKHQIEGIVTGAVESVYQAQRIQKICKELDIWCFNPLWQKPQLKLLNELLENKFKIIVTGIAAYPFEKDWIGRELDKDSIRQLAEYKEKYRINPAGEGGEFESFVYSCPLFKKTIIIKNSAAVYDNYSGYLVIKEAKLA